MIFSLVVSSLNNVNQLICYRNQMTVVEQYFTNIADIQHMGVLWKITVRNLWGDITDMSKYHNGIYRAWIKKYCNLCLKYIATQVVCYNFPLVRNKPHRGARICETGLLERGYFSNDLCHKYLYVSSTDSKIGYPEMIPTGPQSSNQIQFLIARFMGTESS